MCFGYCSRGKMIVSIILVPFEMARYYAPSFSCVQGDKGQRRERKLVLLPVKS